MPSLQQGYEYDVFISYRHNDNRSGWVTEFVNALQDELAATLKDHVSIYFDSNPHHGLHETHDVDGSLKEKVKCLVFIPIVSQTYCDPNAFAWQNELLPFLEFAKQDEFGLDVKLQGGNVAKRVLPVRIHEIDEADKKLFEEQIGGVMRPVDFIYKSSGVNRPLGSDDLKEDNFHQTRYKDQVNKIANAIKEIITGLKSPTSQVGLKSGDPKTASGLGESKPHSRKNLLVGVIGAIAILIAGYLVYSIMNEKEVISVDLEKSIAVLPFTNMSTDLEQQFFADGVMEDILTHLSQMEELHVTSRTSVEKYRDTDKNVREIGAELEVNFLLEGSVRKSSREILITAQLIRTSDDKHLWAKSFPREYSMENLFQIQQDIAQSIVNELQIQISPEEIEEIVQSMSSNEEAYEHFTKGYQYYENYTAEDNEKAIFHFRKAIEIDSTFGRAYGGLANSFNMLRINYGYPSDYKRDSSRYYAFKGMQLDKRCAECFKAYGQSGGADFGEMLERAVSANPNYRTGLFMLSTSRFHNRDFKGSFELLGRLRTVSLRNYYHLLGYIYHNIGITKTGIDCFKLLEKIQPFGTTDAYMYGNLLTFAGDSEAVEQYDLAFELGGDSLRYLTARILELTFDAKYSEVVSYYKENLMPQTTQVSFDWIVYNYYKANKIDEIRDLVINHIESLRQSNPGGKARFLAMIGNLEESISYLSETVENGYLGDISRDRLFEPLYDNSEFIKLVEKQAILRKEVLKLIEDAGLPLPEDISAMVKARL